MNSDLIFDKIEEIAATSSKSEKEALVLASAELEGFQDVLEAALNPFKTYGIAKRPDVPGNNDNSFTQHTWELLDRLRTRDLTGNIARETLSLELQRLSAKSAELLWRIISKDLRAGFSESTVNKAIPGLIPTFDCMLAHPFDESRIKSWPMVAEPKLDGVRVLAFVDISEPAVKFFSRSGKEFTTFDHLKDPLIELVDNFRADIRNETGDDDADASYFKDMLGCDEFHVVFDGEITSGSFNNTVSVARKKDAQATDAVFNIFDVLPENLFRTDVKKGSQSSYHVRRRVLEDLFKSVKAGPLKLLPRYLVSSVGEIHSLYQSVRASGLEGLIIKDHNALYWRKRNHAWMKIKAEETTDVPIVGFEEGTGKYEGMLGALIVAFDKQCFENRTEGSDHDNEQAVRVNIGSGFSDEDRQWFWDHRDEVLGSVIEVEFHEITPDGSLRHPRFKRLRDDKS